MKSTIRESSSSETLDGTREAKRKFRWESISRPWTKRKKKTRVEKSNSKPRNWRIYQQIRGGIGFARASSIGIRSLFEERDDAKSRRME